MGDRMSVGSKAQGLLEKLPAGLAAGLYRGARRIPRLRRAIEAEYESMLELAPGDGITADVAVYPRLPKAGRSRDDVLTDIAALAASEEAEWSEGKASGAVYHGDTDHIEFLNRVYSLQSQSNPLHLDLWPSGMKFEAEVVSMTAAMLGGDSTDDEIVGTVTSGGTESIIMAMKAYRDRAGLAKPEMVIPESAHVAFDKAAQLLGYRQIRVPVGSDGRADVAAMANAIGRNTVVVAGSAPGFPHGVVDPIPELAAMAHERGVGFHTDACLGGFVIPWAERLGHDVPVVDFRNPGVTSVSADTHKYGYAPKGTSVVLYRGRELRHHQFHVATDWPGGLYYSPSLAGSRPGGLIAGAWAAMLSMGEDGYLRATRSILDTAAAIRAGIEAIPELRVIGDPLWVIAFTSDSLDIYEVMAQIARRGWSLNGLHRPPAVHIAVTLRHTQEGVADRFVNDLEEAVGIARTTGGNALTGSAPMYGMAATFPARVAVADLLLRYIDRLYETDGG
ncbi:MAG: aminotransferase class V-fold PLP-dependent enzyme [Acidimicrobiia bacterium]|nr:aminotransferase class V-fold PLP-dependent enzyme [Acidimicrobiia bacterium]